MKKMKESCIILSITLFIILNISTASADIPQLISVQGRLTDTTDTPITTSTNYIFKIHNTPEAGTALWTEPHTIAPDENGIFTALLGSATPLNIPFDEPYWLEVEIQGETLSPRYQMTSAPYALNALEGAGSLECKIYSVDTSCRNYYDNTYTWTDMFPDAKADGYEFKNCWPRTLPSSINDDNFWTYSHCRQKSDCSGPASGFLSVSPSKTDTWESILPDKCGNQWKYTSPEPMDIICCKGGTSLPSPDSTASLECTVRVNGDWVHDSSCQPDEVLTGGGCQCDGSGNVMNGYPIDNTYHCECRGNPGVSCYKVYAICCKGGTSSGGGSGDCPTGFTDTGYGYCIQTDENPAMTWFDASDYCSDTYNARLCSPSEWYSACINSKANGMNSGREWIDEYFERAGYTGGGLGAGTMGGADCSRHGVLGAHSHTQSFRCCRSKSSGEPSSEEKYCKRTTETYNGNLGDIVGADAKCQAEFGTGWSFADTDEELQKIIATNNELYTGTSMIPSYDGVGESDAWANQSTTNNCVSWTWFDEEECDDGYPTLTGTTLRTWWESRVDSCCNENPLWCCPP